MSIKESCSNEVLEEAEQDYFVKLLEGNEELDYIDIHCIATEAQRAFKSDKRYISLMRDIAKEHTEKYLASL